MPRKKKPEPIDPDPTEKSNAYFAQNAIARGIEAGRYWRCSCGLTVSKDYSCPTCAMSQRFGLVYTKVVE